MINQKLNYSAALFFAFIVLSVAFCQLTSRGFDASNAQVADMLSETELFSYADLHQAITASKKDKFLIVDLRERSLFNEKHLPGAINIPKQELLNKQHQKALKTGNTILLYAGQEHLAVAAQTLLFSQGYEAVRVIPGSFESIRMHILEGFNPAKAFYSSDKAQFEFPRFMSVQAIQPKEGSQENPLFPDAPESTPIPGGC